MIPKSDINELHKDNVDKCSYTLGRVFDLNTYVAQQIGLDEGFEYCALEFNKQILFIEEQYYLTTGSTGSTKNQKLLKRLRDIGEPDTMSNERALQDSLRIKFDDTLYDLIFQRALKFVPTVAGQRYLPESKDVIAVVSNSYWANTYVPPAFVAQPLKHVDRPSVLQEYLDRIMPRDRLCWHFEDNKFPQQDYWEMWIAQLVQKPAESNTVAVVLRGDQGTGKGFWCDVMLRPIIGKSNYQAIALADIKGRFLDSIYRSTLLHVEEIHDTKPKTAAILKPLITQEYRQVEEKGLAKHEAKKYFRVVLSSNFDDPVKIEQTDRRHFVSHFSTHLEDQAETKQFYKRFYNWLEKEGGYQHMCNWFWSLDLSDQDFRFPPMTEEKDAITEVETSAEGNIELASMELKNQYDFVSISLKQTQDYWNLSQGNARKALANAGKALANAGFHKLKRRWLGADQNPTNRYVHYSYLETVNEGKTIHLFNSNNRPDVYASAQLPPEEVIIKDEDGAIVPF